MEIDGQNAVQIRNDLIIWPVGKYFRIKTSETIRSVEFEHGGTSWYFLVRTDSNGDSLSRKFKLHHNRSMSQKDSEYFITLLLNKSSKNKEMYCAGMTYSTGANITIGCKPSHQKYFYDAMLYATIIKSEPSDGSKKADMFPGAVKLAADLENLLINKESSDVVLKVGDKEFQAHRAILQARSPVFSAMFQHDTVEKQNGVVDVDDCDTDSFPDFLHYIYTGEVENLSSATVGHLYTTSDKYGLLGLKQECLKYMKGNVSVENFIDVLSLALLYDETELRDIATDFFLANAAIIVVTPKWQTFLANNPVAVNELIVKLSASKAK